MARSALPRLAWVACLVGLVGCDATEEEPAPIRPAREPSHANAAYGPHARQVLDFWKADTEGPAPVVLLIHGGAWDLGEKGSIPGGMLDRLLEAGVSVASMNYRRVKDARRAGVEPPVRWPLEDAARAVQFLRWKAGPWNIDASRGGASGDSAGGASALWLALHDDRAEPGSADPVARESTRLSCAAVVSAQTTLDPAEMRKAIPNATYGGHAFGVGDRSGPEREFEEFLARREELLDTIREYSPMSHVSRDDPPVFLDYPTQVGEPQMGKRQLDPTHSAVFGLLLKQKLKDAGVEARVAHPGNRDPEFVDVTAFLLAHLTGGANP